MKITKAIPARLNKSHLNESELSELAEFQERAMTLEEIQEREAEELQAQEDAVKAAKMKARKEIIAALDLIDKKTIRALRLNETEILIQLENEAIQLRNTLKGI